MGIETGAALSEFANDCRPKWKRRPAADTETGEMRRPRSYDLSRFTGKLNQPKRKWRSGRCIKRSDCESQPVRKVPLFEVAQLGDGPSCPVPSLAPGSDDPVFVMEMRRNSVSFPSLATGGDGPDFGCAERIQSIPVGATQVVRDNPSRFLRFETLESQTTRPFLSANRPRGKRVLARFAPRALNRSASLSTLFLNPFARTFDG